MSKRDEEELSETIVTGVFLIGKSSEPFILENIDDNDDDEDDDGNDEEDDDGNEEDDDVVDDGFLFFLQGFLDLRGDFLQGFLSLQADFLAPGFFLQPPDNFTP